MKKIAVFTSGGDAPGMNSAVRAVVRTGIHYGFEVIGIMRGYQGMMAGEYKKMELRIVSNLLKHGGTILKTSRSKEFMTDAGMQKAADFLHKEEIDGLIAIGGNGTLTGLLGFRKFYKGKIIAMPGTIDNDLYGTDNTIGFHTAVQTALDVIDKIKDTAASHERVFIVEVMGAHSGHVAMHVGICGGAEEILIPEVDTSLLSTITHLISGWRKGKTSSLIVVAEGCSEGGAYQVLEKTKQLDLSVQIGSDGLDCRAVVIGHIQRGGTPVYFDRLLASKLGLFAVEKLIEGADNVMVGEINNQCVTTPIEDAVTKKKSIEPFMMKVAQILSI
ncbi:MAG: 6-phosphofructokinase [Candidatus Magnetominusculus sp. LBB02]|nr:6-phosphofructokinase [Candidatus Magnetominusculus sp. LBB02]